MSDRINSRPVEILLVENNPGDVRLMTEIFRESNMHNTLHTVRDGVEALAFLRREGDYAHAPRPGLILLDLNLPRKDGREVLAEIKEGPGLRRIPVIILTTSAAEQDIVGAYDLRANCYITKPMGLEPFMAVMRSIGDFWLTTVRLPDR
ncbi:MAG: response regulator [Anaerolineae bacterium]|nr:response regulator [Anaerolineae bacterium]